MYEAMLVLHRSIRISFSSPISNINCKAPNIIPSHFVSPTILGVLNLFSNSAFDEICLYGWVGEKIRTGKSFAFGFLFFLPLLSREFPLSVSLLHKFLLQKCLETFDGFRFR